ncbi:hypothetical protein MKX03_014226 [Papaver bracteatum]|nr:hypothetical protein MKX03_014226 [Papaver bracteatum]
MAKKNTPILCLFLVLLIFFAGVNARNQRTENTCTDKWETPCVTEEDCKDKCHQDHGKKAKPMCTVRVIEGHPDLCECRYNC